MEIKKNPKVNLEKFRSLFLMIGLVVTTGIVVSFFGWKSSSGQADSLGKVQAVVDDEMAEITRQDKPPETLEHEPPKEQPKTEIIQIVEDDKVVEDDFDFDVEADEETEIDIVEIEDVEEEEDENVVFLVVEKNPEYPGGLLALRRFIADNVNYPAVARENDIQGTVYLRFVVLRTGKVGAVEIQRGVDPLLDNEAVRVVKALKKFAPGQQGGKKVNVWFSLPIVFTLN